MLRAHLQLLTFSRIPILTYLSSSFLSHSLCTGGNGVGLCITLASGFTWGSNGNSYTHPKLSWLHANPCSNSNNSLRKFFHSSQGATPNFVSLNRAYLCYCCSIVNPWLKTPSSRSSFSKFSCCGILVQISSKVPLKALATAPKKSDDLSRFVHPSGCVCQRNAYYLSPLFKLQHCLDFPICYGINQKSS